MDQRAVDRDASTDRVSLVERELPPRASSLPLGAISCAAGVAAGALNGLSSPPEQCGEWLRPDGDGLAPRPAALRFQIRQSRAAHQIRCPMRLDASRV